MIKVAFFTEAGTKRGMGHLIRTHTICETFRQNNIQTFFFLDSDIDFGYKFNDLISFTWENLSLYQTYDIIFIDSYEANISIYQTLANHSKIAVYLDDYGRLVYPEGVILNFAPESERLFFQIKNQNITYLLGTSYVPIREVFLKQVMQKNDQLFIMLGGNDINNLSIEIINILQNITIPKVVVTNSESSKNILDSYQNLQVLYKPTDDELASNMAKSSFAISTASMSIYEFSYLQIPTLIIATTKNQQIGASQLIEYKLAHSFVDLSRKSWKEDMLGSVKTMISQHITFPKITDGNGAKRIFDTIVKLVEK